MIKVGIDIGNSKISLIVCDIKNDNTKKVLSFISYPTNYVKKSMITNLIFVKEEIHKVINEAAKASQTEIKSINLADKIKEGSKIPVLLEKIEDKNGDVIVSAVKAHNIKGWHELERAYEANEPIMGKIKSKCNVN